MAFSVETLGAELGLTREEVAALMQKLMASGAYADEAAALNAIVDESTDPGELISVIAEYMQDDGEPISQFHELDGSLKGGPWGPEAWGDDILGEGEEEGQFTMLLDEDDEPDYEASVAHLAKHMPGLRWKLLSPFGGSGGGLPEVGARGMPDAMKRFNTWYDGEEETDFDIPPFEKDADYWKQKYMELKAKQGTPNTLPSDEKVKEDKTEVSDANLKTSATKPSNTLAKLIGSLRY